jgi:hypothetical protein
MQPLTLAWWGGRNLPEPTTMCGRWLTTTSRVILNAPTGLGKSMFTVALGMAIAACKDFLSWKAADRPFRVLYIDGEMSNRLLKQRLADEARRLGYAPETFYALSHEDLALGPLNTPAGQKQIESVITMLGGLDLIMFDNVMSLIPGDQKEEEGWAKVTPWVRSLTRRSIGQFWVHHTGHDKTHGYGTKTREWQMDTTIHLTEVKRGNTDISFKLEFHKARERRPETRMDFKETRVALIGDRWTGTGVTGFEEPFHVPPTLQELGWTEQLAAWAGDECERLKLPPDAQTPITAPAAQEAWAVEGKKHSRQAAQKRLQQLTETGLLRKMGYGQWALVPKPT